MATGNVDCSLSEGMYNFSQPLNLNIFNSSNISDCDERQNCLTMLPTIPSDIDSSNETVDNLANHLLNQCVLDQAKDRNENISNTETSSSEDKKQEPFMAAINDNENSLSHDNENSSSHVDIIKHDSCPMLKLQNTMPEELFINVESDDEGVHSWRPNMSSNSLCSDFFISPGIHQEGFDLSLPFSFENQSDNSKSMPLLVDWTSEFQDSSNVEEQEASQIYIPQSFVNSPKFNRKSHIQSQMAGLNFVRYEVINAQRKVHALEEDLKQLTRKLNEKHVVQRALEIEKLREENAELRLECQCLCMEVDYYLKGKAPLGEIDETFYNCKPQPEENIASQDQAIAASKPSSQVNDETEKMDGLKLWECCKCTFANHPAIHFCEMCQTKRPKKNDLSSSAALTDSCYDSKNMTDS